MLYTSIAHSGGMRKVMPPPAPLRRAATPAKPPPTPTRQELAPPAALADSEEIITGRRKARLRDLIEREGSGGSVSLARRAGVNQAHINHLSLPGYPFGARAARGLEQRLDLPHMYFDQAPATAGAARQAPTVPIQPWRDLGRFAPQPDAPTVPVPWDVGPRAVAGLANGAMWANETGVPRGWYAVVDPDVQVREGDLVACWLPGSHEATLRHFVMDGGRRLLYPLDPRHPAIDEWGGDTLVWGPVIGALKNFRQ